MTEQAFGMFLSLETSMLPHVIKPTVQVWRINVQCLPGTWVLGTGAGRSHKMKMRHHDKYVLN